jgi:hypothetical protein
MMCFYILGIFYWHFNDLAFDAATPLSSLHFLKGSVYSVCMNLHLFFILAEFFIYFSLTLSPSFLSFPWCLFEKFFIFIFLSFYFCFVLLLWNFCLFFKKIGISDSSFFWASFSFTNLFFPTVLCHRWYFVLAAFTFFPNWFSTKKINSGRLFAI